MGLPSSSYREFFFIQRKNDISLELNRLADDKVSLSRESEKNTRNYQNALNSTIFKWSDNGGVSYVDLSYSNLMTPSAMNKMDPYVITDSNDRVVIASNYEKYAKMISSDGKAGGDYQSNRGQILSELTGIDASKINAITDYDNAITTAEAKLKGLKEPQKKFEKHSTQELLKRASTSGLSFNKSCNNWADAYNSGATLSLGKGSSAVSTCDSAIDNLAKSISKYFGVEDYGEKFQQAIDSIKKDCKTLLEASSAELNGGLITGNSSSGYTLNAKDLVLAIWGAYSEAGGEIYETTSMTGGTGDLAVIWYDVDDTTNYNNWKTANEEYIKNKELYTQEYNAAKEARAQLLGGSDNEKQIAFYDAIFTAIADKGWVQNNKITDNDYLNEMMQNGLYSLTTMSKSLYTDGQNEDGTAQFIYEYKTDIAENNTHIYKVKDSDIQNEALVEYEYQKSIINAKESKIDTRMQNLKTEQSAIQQMLEGLKQVKNDNIERTFSIMS